MSQIKIQIVPPIVSTLQILSAEQKGGRSRDVWQRSEVARREDTGRQTDRQGHVGGRGGEVLLEAI
jgi:hypothetical protein